jgi:hypothetical protein
MLSNKPITFTLVANLVIGQPADGHALAKAIFNKIGDVEAARQQ